MADSFPPGVTDAALLVDVFAWFTDNPIIAAILLGLLALFFFFYLMIRRAIVGFKEGMRGE